MTHRLSGTAFAVILAGLLYAPPANACGGLFCNATQPVQQSAERILFVVDRGRLYMHVRLTYSGPPADFGWLLPVPRDVVTSLSSEALFQVLDQNFTPRFQLDVRRDPTCERPERPEDEFWADAGFQASPDSGGDPDPPRVQVLSRETVGPYDRALLVAESVADLREWLDDNDYAIPPETDARLVPYVEAGAAFVAIKLVADASSNDVVPLMLDMPLNRPSIPIIPTAVAADPDMGIIVHVLGDARAVPINYAHVEINEAAIDWRRGGANYTDVVSQAADEAGGEAFATDFAGRISLDDMQAVAPIADAVLTRVADVRDLDDLQASGLELTDPDILRVLASEFGVPERASPRSFFNCPECFDVQNDRIDGGAVAHRLEMEVQPARAHLLDQLSRHSYLTRLFSTLSPEEMRMDPVFSFNVDLPEVASTRRADLFIPCNEDGVGWNEAGGVYTLASGEQFPATREPTQRQAGVTMRGSLPAAAKIGHLTEAGPPIWYVVNPMPPMPPTPTNSGSSGCSAAPAPWFGALGLLALVRLRRS